MLPHNQTTINQLLHRVAEGDEHAFRELVTIYSDKVFTHALTFVKNWSHAQELTQDIFVKVWQNRNKLSQVDNWENYLFIISKYYLISAMRRKVTETEDIDPDRVEELIQRPDTQYDNKALGKLLDAAIAQLPEKKRKVFQLIHLQGLPQEQVGRELGMATRTVRWNLVAAINELRDYLHRNAADEFLGLCLASFLFFPKT